MFKISESASIALHSMVYIANRDNQVIPLREISGKFNISEHHLSKVLQRLSKGGFIKSIKGPKGGFSIVPEFKNLTFLDVYEVIEGKVDRQQCLFNNHPHHCEKCIMNNLIDEINQRFISYMETHRLLDSKL